MMSSWRLIQQNCFSGLKFWQSISILTINTVSMHRLGHHNTKFAIMFLIPHICWFGILVMGAVQYRPSCLDVVYQFEKSISTSPKHLKNDTTILTNLHDCVLLPRTASLDAAMLHCAASDFSLCLFRLSGWKWLKCTEVLLPDSNSGGVVRGSAGIQEFNPQAT